MIWKLIEKNQLVIVCVFPYTASLWFEDSVDSLEGGSTLSGVESTSFSKPVLKFILTDQMYVSFYASSYNAFNSNSDRVYFLIKGCSPIWETHTSLTRIHLLLFSYHLVCLASLSLLKSLLSGLPATWDQKAWTEFSCTSYIHSEPSQCWQLHYKEESFSMLLIPNLSLSFTDLCIKPMRIAFKWHAWYSYC